MMISGQHALKRVLVNSVRRTLRSGGVVRRAWASGQAAPAPGAGTRVVMVSPDDPAPAGHVVCDAVVNECALAAMPERGEDDAGYRLAESVLRRFRQLAAGPAQQDRRSGQGALGLVLSGGLGYIRVSAVLGIHPHEMAALLRAVLRKLTTSPPAAAEGGDQV